MAKKNLPKIKPKRKNKYHIKLGLNGTLNELLEVVVSAANSKNDGNKVQS